MCCSIGRVCKSAWGEIMFCDGCGTTVQPGQAFCSRCGKQIVGNLTAMLPRPGRVQAHTHLLGILWLAISAFNTIAGVVLYVLANTLFAHMHELGAPQAPTAFLRPLLTVIGIFVLAKAAFGFMAGGVCCNANHGLESLPWCSASSRCSMFPSARLWAFIPSGSCCHGSHKRNTMPWPRFAPPHS